MLLEAASPAPTSMVSALAMPLFDPGAGRTALTLPEGATVAEIIDQALPGLPDEGRARLRVTLSRGDRIAAVPAGAWHRCRPRAGTHVVIRLLPAGQALRAILSVIVTIAAIAIGQVWLGPLLASTFGIGQTVAAAVATAALLAVGQFLLNALIPVKDPKKDKPVFEISGLRNQANPEGPVPLPMGRMRMAPVYACPPYPEIVGDQQYIRALFIYGIGPLAVTDRKIGDTSIDEFDEIEREFRPGLPGDAPITLVRGQTIPDNFAVDLTRDIERDDAGEPVPGGSVVEKPVVRYMATDCTEASIIVAFPGGLTRVNDEGERRSRTVEIRIRHRRIGETAWLDVTMLRVTAARTEPFWRQHTWALPVRGAYEIELTRMTRESSSTNVQDRCAWVTLLSIRPEYPLNFPFPVCVEAVRIKATAQLSGQLDSWNAVVSRIAPDWDAATESWVTRETRSPAAAMLFALRSPGAAYPAADADIDLDQMAEFSEWCEAKGLRYDAPHADETSLFDGLAAMASAGRASPRHDGRRHGVVIDRPQSLVVDHVNPRNSWGFRRSRTYLRRPDGLRVRFADASNNWQAGERVVPWPGHTGDILVTEALELPGKTDPDEIYREATRRMLEMEARPDQIQVQQLGQARVATRGDLVAVSHWQLEATQSAARVRRVAGFLVELDATVTMVAGVTYGLRFRVFDGPDDVIGVSVVREVVTEQGEQGAVRLVAPASVMPAIGAIVHFGKLAEDSMMCRVRGTESGQGGTVVLHLVAAAPEIDAAVDALVIPPWDGRVGSILGDAGAVPAVPRIVFIRSGEAGTGDVNGLVVQLAPGTGSAAVVVGYEIDHRLAGAPTWSTTTVTAAASGGDIAGYLKGQSVQIRARAISIGGSVGAYATVRSLVIGERDPVVAPVLSFTATPTATGAWRFAWTVADPTTEAFADLRGVRIRAAAGAGRVWADLEPIHTGVLVSSPAEIARPEEPDVYTFGIYVIDATGRVSEPVLITALSAGIGGVLGTGDGGVLGTGDADGSILGTGD